MLEHLAQVLHLPVAVSEESSVLSEQSVLAEESAVLVALPPFIENIVKVHSKRKILIHRRTNLLGISKQPEMMLPTVAEFCAKLEAEALRAAARRTVLWFSFMQNLSSCLDERRTSLRNEWIALAKDVVGELVVCRVL